jgi:hypothetical protein
MLKADGNTQHPAPTSSSAPAANPPGQPGIPAPNTLDAALNAFSGNTAASGVNPKNPPVYLGQTTRTTIPFMGPNIPGGTTGNTFAVKGGQQIPVDNMSTLDEASQQYYNWDNATKNKFITQLNLAGINASGLSDTQLQAQWASYVGQAANYYAAGQRYTPWDILAKDMASRESAPARSVTQTSTNYNMSSADDAHAIFLQASQSLLGRDPTKGEIATFKGRLNAYEKANPSVTTTTSSYKGNDLTGQTSTTSGGVSADSRNMMAMEKAKAEPEYGAYQAATTYMDALMKTISGG